MRGTRMCLNVTECDGHARQALRAEARRPNVPECAECDGRVWVRRLWIAARLVNNEYALSARTIDSWQMAASGEARRRFTGKDVLDLRASRRGRCARYSYIVPIARGTCYHRLCRRLDLSAKREGLRRD
eukprot:1183005-Prorocentrum_minimum.AAC.4